MQWTNRAMVRVSEPLRRWNTEGWDGFITLQVHDELGISVPERYAYQLGVQLRQMVRDLGEELNLLVPLEISVSCGPSWGENEATKYD